MPTLEINVASVNIKKVDLKVYGIEKPMCKVVLECEGKTQETKELFGLDPIWEEDFTFEISDPESVQVKGTFYCAGVKMGDTHSYPLNKLIKMKPTFKAIIVPGGKVDMMFKATDFGDEDAPQDDDGFMDFL